MISLAYNSKTKKLHNGFKFTTKFNAQLLNNIGEVVSAHVGLYKHSVRQHNSAEADKNDQ